MHPKLLAASLLAFSLTSLPAWACPTGNPRDLNYIRRDNNRCEGIQSRSLISSNLGLVSLSTSTNAPLGNNLTIRVPNVGGGTPNVLVRAIEERYQLDAMALTDSGGFYSFSLPTTVLSAANIALDALYATATSGDWVVYVPVILQQPAPEYKFVFFSNGSASFRRAEIRKDGRTVAAWGPQGARRGEKPFSWTPGAASAGRYEFYYEATVEPTSGPAEEIETRFFFEHNPNWLR